jgi:hypothetical protein
VWSKTVTYFNNGKDELQFYFQPIKELILLLKKGFWWRNVENYVSCKGNTTQYSKLPTLIFDEIDTVFLEKLLSKWERDYERDEVCRFCYYTFHLKLQAR